MTAESLVLSTYLPQAALATGTMYVPQDMTARIHQGEIVMPRTFADEYRSNLSAGGGAPGAGGGITHNHFSPSITINGSKMSAREMQTATVAALKQAHRELNI